MKAFYCSLDPNRLTTVASAALEDRQPMVYWTDDRFAELIEAGTINPAMRRNDASAETRRERHRAARCGAKAKAGTTES